MNQNITDEQMEALLKGKSVLGEPTKLSRKQVLEATVQKRTPQYISLNNPQYDQELMEAHLELATIYDAEGNVAKAHSNFSAAEHEFSNMSRVETQQPKYIMVGKEGFQRFQEQKSAIEKRLGDYKSRLVETAGKIGYDTMNLMFIPTSDTPKRNLVELIK
jgi:hypothetical protein|tara:strand:+ start:152 stop:634 length:483 start_codon:yes stop_codon:yes gene_type:complete